MILMPPMLFHTLSDGPQRVAPFSHAVSIGPWVFVTGQMPTDPLDNTLPLPEGVEAQTRQVMANLTRVLEGLDCSLADVAQARIYLTHFQRDYEAMNATYAACFPADRLPARTCVGVTGLARDALVEIDLLVYRPGSEGA
ncbi:RidA family protein [Rhodovarius crocodyli]|nr:RidA family protein [Rhodovarius crocodyli]